MSEQASVGGLRVRDTGSGPPALLIHGFTGAASAWPEVCLDGLGRRSRLLIPDLPGHGGTGGPTTPEAYGMPRVLDALTEVLDRASIERAVWIGYSMGGRIALAASVLRPERVLALVLESSSPGLVTEAERAARRDRDDRLAGQILQDGVAAFVSTWMSQPLFATQERLGREVLETERTRRLRNDAKALAACLRGLGTGSQPSFWERLEEVTVPTLVLTGALDGKFTDIGQRMVRAMPDAYHEITPEAGHAVHLERPGEWVSNVTRFLDGLAQVGGLSQDWGDPRLGPRGRGQESGTGGS